MRQCQIRRLGYSIAGTFEQLSHVKVVPRFFPFLVAPPIRPAFESVRGGGVPETLNASSMGTELLTPFLVVALSIGIATGMVGVRLELVEMSGPGGDTEEDIDSEAKELRVVAGVGSTTGLGTHVRAK